MKSIFAAVFAFIILSAPRAHATETIVVAAGGFVQAYLHAVKDKFEAATNVHLDFLREKGMQGDAVLLTVDQGKADVGLVGFNREEMRKMVKEKNLMVKNIDTIQHRVIGKDMIYIVTYKGGPKALTRAQLKQVLTGQVLNWNQIGGETAAIQIMLPGNSRVSQSLISKSLLDGDDIYRKGVKEVNDHEELAKLVGNTRGALSFASGGERVFEYVNRPVQPEVSRDLVMITLGNPKPNVMKLIEFYEKNAPK
jgi:ABC-type phosphate transport system substrate-binding protein